MILKTSCLRPVSYTHLDVYKRQGQAVTLRELMDEVGSDAARYFFCSRTLDSQMDFDIDLAKKQSSDNPVYYIQYANARIHSLFAQAKEAGVKWGDWEKTDFTKLTEECELDLVKKMENYHMLIDGAATERAPQRIAKYAYEPVSYTHLDVYKRQSTYCISYVL